MDKRGKTLKLPVNQLFKTYFSGIKTTVGHIETNLETIRNHALAAEAENGRFRDFLKERNREQIDEAVFALNESISPKISCTDCGNCCKSLMVLISNPEADHLAQHLKQSREDFDREYLEKGSNGLMIMNRMPCPFLDKNRCSVYEHRFEGCKEFPALHLPNFKDRLFTTFMHYDRCPIIFNVVEQLKNTMGFQKDAEVI